jgi:acyl-coenzyme A synthetase/AMP-(fatty) acid ligase
MITSRLFEWARRQPDKIAVVRNDTALSYAAFARTIAATTDYLAKQGPPQSGTAVVLAKDLLESWFIIMALRSLGLDTISVASLPQIDELKIRNAACLVVPQIDQLVHNINTRSLPGAKVIAVPATVASDALAGDLPAPHKGARPFGGHVLYTTGTTGANKRVLLDGANDDGRIGFCAEFLGFDSKTVYHSSFFAHWTSAGFRLPNAAWHVGGTVVIDQRPGYLGNLLDHGTTHAAMMPNGIKHYLEEGQMPHPASVGLEIVTAGGFVPLPVAEKIIAQRSVRLTLMFGSTETGPVMRSRVRNDDDVLWLEPDSRRTIQIVDENGEECGVDQEGDLRVRLTEIDATGYVDDDESTARMFRDGYFYPGDLARRRADGRFRILGRVTDVINFQGNKIAVAPIEQQIQQRLRVDEVCLFAGPGNDGLDDVVVAIRSKETLPKDELGEVARDFLSRFERVRFAVLKEFPQTATGNTKTRRAALRKLVFDQAEPLH